MATPTAADIRNALIGLRQSEIAPLGMNVDMIAALLCLLVDKSGSGATESNSQRFLTADDRIITTNYSDTSKQTTSSVVITSISVTAATGKTQLTITFTNPSNTSDRVTYVVA